MYASNIISRRKKSFLVLLLCCYFTMVFVFSAFYEVHMANHDCIGEDCPICAAIQISEDTVRRIGATVQMTASLTVIVICMLATVFCISSVCERETLVSRKVRMDM